MTDIKIQQYQKTLDKTLESDDHAKIIDAYINLGRAYLEIKDTPKGYTQFDQALKVATQAKDQLSEARLLGMIGVCLKQIGNYETAMQSFRKSLRTARKVADPVLEGDALYHIGALLVDQGEPLEAISHLDNALMLSLQNQDRKRKLAVTNLMGNIFLQLESIDKAIENYATALETAVSLNDKEAEAASRVHLGQTFILDENYDAATENFEVALSLADQLGLAPIELQALYGLTQASAGAEKISLAVIYGEQLIQKARQSNAQAEEVQAIQTLTGILSKNSNYAKTIPYLLRGVEISQQKQDLDWELKFLSDVGMAYYLNDELENADQYLQQAYDNAIRMQKKLEEAVLAGRLSSVRADMGKVEAAIVLNKHAVTLAEELDDPILKAEQLVLLALNYLELEAPEQAESYLLQAKEIYLELDEIKFLVQVEKLLHEIRDQNGQTIDPQ